MSLDTINLAQLNESRGAQPPPKKIHMFGKISGVMLFILVCIAGYSYQLTGPSSEFLPNTLVEIPEGTSLSNIATNLKAHNIIRSTFIFSVIISQSGQEKHISSGPYLFRSPLTIFEVANRFIEKDHGIATEKITLREGLTVREMTQLISKNLSSFNSENFFSLSTNDEGFLFPDTYFFLSTATSGEVHLALRKNFEERTASFQVEATSKKVSWYQIITMASIIEGEAVTHEDRQIVSGILWKRLKNGMRLGVDAPFVYIMGKGSLELTQSDLATSSPYNTYRSIGLPPTPINNPGLDAIDASLHPTESPYFYYLSDKAGKMYYAKTFDEHKLNKVKHLR